MRVDINPIPRFPAFTPRQAMAYARGEVTHPDKDYKGMCLHFCAWSYGFQSSGVKDATSFWRGMPASQKIAGDKTPPAGAIACWTGGSAGHGHAAIVLGKNAKGETMIASNDIKRSGKIDIVPLSRISEKWGLKYEGWTKPYFPFGERASRTAPDVYKKEFGHGKVYQSKMKYGVSGSASVKRLQTRLGIKATGNYNAATKSAVASWLKKHGYPNNDGSSLNLAQLNKLFASNYFVIPAK